MSNDLITVPCIDTPPEGITQDGALPNHPTGSRHFGPVPVDPRGVMDFVLSDSFYSFGMIRFLSLPGGGVGHDQAATAGTAAASCALSFTRIR